VLLGTDGVAGVKDGLTFAVESKNYRQDIALPADVVTLQNQFVTETASVTSLGGVFRTVGNNFMEEPLAVLKLYLIKVARSWYGTDSGSMESASLIVQLFYGVLVLLASFLVWRTRIVSAGGLLLFVWSFVFYFWAMTTLVLSILRYMAPSVGLFSLLIPQLVTIVPRRFLILRSH